MLHTIHEYIAIGFPLIVGAALALLFPIKLKNYFSPQQIENLSSRLMPTEISLKNCIYIFIVYLISATVLSIAQAYLLWDFASDSGVRFSSRLTDFILYPIIPSALMAVFVMWFVFAYDVYRKGDETVKKFLLRSYDGFTLFREIKRFRLLLMASALLCFAANLWTYNVYLYVTDEAIVTSNHKRLGPSVYKYDRIEFFRLEWHRGVRDDNGKDAFILSFKLKGGGFRRTDLNLLYNEHMLQDIEKIIEASEDASGRKFSVVFDEYPSVNSPGLQGMFGNKQ